MTDKQIVAKANQLATAFAEFDGYQYPAAHLFHADPSPRAQRYWALAALAFEELKATDVNDTLACLGLERA